MEKVFGQSRLLRRGAAYYFHVKIPVDLREQYSPKLVIKFSLRTKDRVEAARRVRIESVKIDEEFAALRNGKRHYPGRTVELTAPQVHSIGSAWLSRWLHSDEEARARGLSDAEFANIENWTAWFSEEWRAALASGDTSETLKEAEVLAKEFLSVGSIATPESVRSVAFELLKQRVRYLETLQDRQRGDFAPTPIAIPHLPATTHGASPSISEVLTNYNKERKLPAKTFDEWERIFARFITMHGDLQIAQVVKGHVCWRRLNLDHLCRLNFDQGLLLT